jgi:hypothetical protein
MVHQARDDGKPQNIAVRLSAKDILWDNDKRQSAYKVISRLLAAQTDRGWETSWQHSLDTFAIQALSKGKVKAGHVLSVLARMRNLGVEIPDQFEPQFVALIDENRQEQLSGIKQWQFLFPFRIELDRKIKLPFSLNCLGVEFVFRPWNEVLDEIGHERLKPALVRVSHRPYPNLSRSLCLTVSVGSHDFWSAWKKLEPAFDTLRGVIEINVNVGSTRYSSNPLPRRKVACPAWPIGIADSHPEFANFYVPELNDNDSAYKLREIDLKWIKRSLKLIARIPDDGSLQGLLVDCLRLYSQAMDANFNHECFLSLWRLAEAMTLAERQQGSKKVVCSRLAWLGRDGSNTDWTYLRDVLDWLYKKRNEAVHRGLHTDIEDEDVNVLKICCDMSLSWLSGQAKTLPTANHLEQFYVLLNQSEAGLVAITKAVKHVKRVRSLESKPKQKLVKRKKNAAT